MQQNNKKRICRNCGKPLQSEKCTKCGGTGFVSHFFFWEKECNSCKSTGTIFSCPDHPFGFLDFPKTYQTPIHLDLKYTNIPKIQSGQLLCRRCFGSGWITNPITFQKEPCPVCRNIRYPENIQSTDSPPSTPYRDSDRDGRPDQVDNNPYTPWWK